MARIVAPSSLHTEDEERFFSVINNISQNTSSRTKESVRDNSIIRIQIEEKLRRSGNLGSHYNVKALNSKISKLSTQLGKYYCLLLTCV